MNVISMKQTFSVLVVTVVVCVCLFDVTEVDGAVLRTKRSIWNSRIMDLKRQMQASNAEGGQEKGTSYGYLYRVWPPRYRKRNPDSEEIDDPLDEQEARRQQLKYDLLGYY